MAKTNQEWEALGRNIQEIVDKAVSAADYQKLNQTIRLEPTVVEPLFPEHHHLVWLAAIGELGS